MGNKYVKLFLVFVVLMTSLFCLNKYVSVKADSGWDSDFDSGGDSWSSDYSSHDSSSTSRVYCDSEDCKKINYVTVCTATAIIGVVILIIFLKSSKEMKKAIIKYILYVLAMLFIISIIVFISVAYFLPIVYIIPFGVLVIAIVSIKKLYKPYYSWQDINNYNQISEEQANNIIQKFSVEEFNFKAYQIFYDVQMGWMEFDYDKLKRLLTDELYNMYQMDLEALKLKNQKNVMKKFELIKIKLIDLKEENNTYVAQVVLEVKFIDYVEDMKTHSVKRGSSRRKLDNTYKLTFIKTKNQRENICPNCGAKLKGNNSSECEYCKSKIINNNYDWVMSKKEKIHQK